MKTRITVTGHKGFIGSHLMKRLHYNKYYFAGSFDILAGNNIFDDTLDYVINQANVVVHLAALTSVKESFDSPEEYYKTNVLGTARVVQKCLEHDTKLIYVSSASIKDNLSSPYAESKHLAENIVKLFLDSADVTILRPENVYGKGMKRGTLIWNYLNNKELIVDGDGQQTRDYIHVEDVVDIIIKAVENNWNGKIIPVGTGKSFSVNEIAKFFNELTGKPIVNKRINGVGVKKSVADITILKELCKDDFRYNLYDWIKGELK